MIIPIRCFTCGKVLADKWFYYEKEARAIDNDYQEMMVRENIQKYASDSIDKIDKIDKNSASSVDAKNAKDTKDTKEKNKKYKNIEETYKKEILDKLGLNRYCCRRHFLGNVDMMGKI